MAMFLGNKSYFKCKMEGLAFLAKDNKEYVVISSSKEEEQTIFGAYLVFLLLGTSNKYKRDECGRVLRGLLIFVDFRGFLEVLSQCYT